MDKPTLSDDVGIAGFLQVAGYVESGSTRLTTKLSQAGTTVIGENGDFTLAMQGGIVSYADGKSAFIVAFVSAFSLTVSPALTEAVQSATIIYGGYQANASGVSAPTISTSDLVSIDISASHDVNVGHDVNVTNSVNTAGMVATGDVVIGGTLNVTGTVIVDNIMASGTVTGANLVATVEVTTVSLNVTGLATINQISAGAAGIVCAGNIQGVNITATSALTSDGAFTASSTVSMPTVASAKGDILVSNGSTLTSLAPGVDGTSIFYNSATSTGLSTTIPSVGPFTNDANPNFTGGSLNLTPTRISTLGTVFIDAPLTFTNTSGGAAAFALTYDTSIHTNLVPFLPTNSNIYLINATINGTPTVSLMGIRTNGVGPSFEVSLSNTTTITPWTFTWPNGTTIKINSINVCYVCNGS